MSGLSLPANLLKDQVEKARLQSCYTHHDVPMPAFNHRGYICLHVLPCLIGQPFDTFALGLIHALRPSRIRVSRGMVTTDSIMWRVTVIVSDQDIIESIEQQVEVGVPDGFTCGSDVYAEARKRGIVLTR